MDLGVAVVAVFFAGMGVVALVRPRAIVERFGTRIDHPDARTEVRAVYGGFGLVVAGSLLVAGSRTDPYARGLVAAVALALVGMAAGRVVGLLIERTGRVALHPTVTFLIAELAMAGLLARSL